MKKAIFPLWAPLYSLTHFTNLAKTQQAQYNPTALYLIFVSDEVRLFACGWTHAEDSSSMIATDWRSPSLVPVSEVYDFDTEIWRLCSYHHRRCSCGVSNVLRWVRAASDKPWKMAVPNGQPYKLQYGETWLSWRVLENVPLNKPLLHLCYQSAATKQLMIWVLTDQVSHISTTM